MVETPHIAYFDGGVLYSRHDLHYEVNHLSLYVGATLPGLGFVVQNTDRFASGYDFYANMVNKSSGTTVFVNRSVELTTRDTLDPDYPDDDPVMVLWLASGDVNVAGNYEIQIRAVSESAVTGIEFFRPIELELLEW